MAKPRVPEWTLDGVLDEVASIDDSMRDRQFAFILGSGASFTSRIPTGKDLAENWLRELHKRECHDGSDCDSWLAGPGLGIGGLTFANAAEHYPRIFERRFRGDREAGYAALERAMEGKTPSLGYSLLAEIIQHTRHKVVVTTNFDNLVADALAMHAHQSPLVVAHESLTGFVRPQLRRPLVAKIHRDLFLNPKNDEVGVSTMEEGWRTALKKLFQYFTPIVVGYGGNDGSLMGLLASLEPGDIVGRMVWCYRDGSPPPPIAMEVLARHGGVTVTIPGFDELMLLLSARLVKDFDLAEIADRTERLGQERARRYRDQAEELQRKSKMGTPARQRAAEVISQSVQPGRTWWSYEIAAQRETDADKRQAILEEGLRHYPKSAELLAAYARFLQTARGDYDGAERRFAESLEIQADSTQTLVEYAVLLARQGKLEAAETYYNRALALAPDDGIVAANYAVFLESDRGDLAAADAMYARALAAAPENAAILNGYAVFLEVRLRDLGRAEQAYEDARKRQPQDAAIAANYADFLGQRGDLERAQALFEEAYRLDSSNALTSTMFADFLSDKRKRYDDAARFYQRAMELEPNNAKYVGNYAVFLDTQLEDREAAQPYYERALALDPTLGSRLGNLAESLEAKGDLATAERLYRRAVELGPTDGDHERKLRRMLDRRKTPPSSAAPG